MKIKLKLLDKIIAVCTSAEIDFIIYLSQFQNEKGIINDVFYKDVVEILCISKSTFYLILNNLVKKGIIKAENSKIFAHWNFELLDNNFTKSDYSKGGYLNTNKNILHSTVFRKATKTVKIIILKIIILNQKQRSEIKLTINTLLKWTQVSFTHLRNSLKELKKLINFKIDNRRIIVSVNPIISICGMRVIDTPSELLSRPMNESDTLHKHYLHTLYKSNMIVKRNDDFEIFLNSSDDIKREFHDTLKVFKSYKNSVGINKTLEVTNICLSLYGELIAKYINSALYKIKNRIKAKQHTVNPTADKPLC